MNGNMVYLASSRGCCAQSHKRCYKSNPSSIPEFQPGNGEILEGLTTVCNPYLKASAEKFYNPTGLSGKRYILHYYGRIL
jgi:hypothetical protein